MLIDSPRLSHADRVCWERLEHYDDALSRDPRIARLTDRAKAAVTEFATAGDCYMSVSWGKDSVVAAHLALTAVPGLPVRWARARHVEMPECEQVRDRFLAIHPRARYDEVVFDFPVPLRGEPGHDTADRYDALGTLLTGRYISGLRAEESRMRRISIGHRGLVTANTCRPIGGWDATQVFAYLHAENLPVHPAYAMSMGGHWDRRWLRVHPLGTANPASSAVHGNDRDAWEDHYYTDVLDAARAARAHLWTPA